MGLSLPKSFDRREFLAKAAKGGACFTLAGATGTLLSACGGNGDVKETSTTKGVAAARAIGVHFPPAGTKLGGSMTMGVEAEESSMDPSFGHFDSTGVMYARTVFDPLAMFTEKAEVVPYLAESIVPNSTFTEWTINMRPNIMFHDGTPCDGAALTFCMKTFQASGLVNFALTYWVPNAPKTTGPLSCTIKMNAPWVSFPAWLAGYIGGQVAYIFSPTQYMKSETLTATQPVGTGPFMFSHWDVNHFFAVVKNPHYWRKDALGRQLPYLDSWTFKPIPVVSQRYDALEANEIQLMHTDDDPTILQIESNSQLQNLLDDEIPYGEPDCDFGMINVKDSVMSDPRLRQACAYAFSQSEYATDIGRGLIKPITGPFSQPSPYYSATSYPQYDLAKAKSLVASWMADHGGKAPSITYTTTSSPTSLTSAQFVQNLFKNAGFECQIAQVLQSKLIDDAVAGSFQIFSWRQFAQPDPDLNYVFWSSKGGVVNFTHNDDPKVDAALDRARQTTDQETRVEAYQEVAARFAVDLPYIWAGRDVWCVATQKAVQNWNNFTQPAGQRTRGLSMISGIIWPTEIWTTDA